MWNGLALCLERKAHVEFRRLRVLAHVYSGALGQRIEQCIECVRLCRKHRLAALHIASGYSVGLLAQLVSERHHFRFRCRAVEHC